MSKRNRAKYLSCVWVGVLAFTYVVRIATAGEASDVALREARIAVEAGKFAEADALIAPHITDPDAPITKPFAILREQMRRIRRDYRLSAEALLLKLKQSIPDATMADVERWRDSGDLQHRVIDGETWYFARAVGTLLRYCPEAKARRQHVIKPASDRFDLPRHLERLVARAEKGNGAEVFPVKHTVTYTLTVKPGNEHAKPGATVRCWLPFPQEYRQQRDVKLLRSEPEGARVAPKDAPQRTVYFERGIDSADEPLAFSATYEFVTSAYCPLPNPADVKPYDKSSALYREYTAEREPHIVFSPEVLRIVRDVVGDETNPLLAARKIFRWMDANVPWCAEMEYSTIFNLSAKGLSARRGDCGVQGMTFITLCRAAGIPARWQSGWETKPINWNMHDWSEFYVEPWGWLPADASYGLQNHRDPRVAAFYCGNLDPYRMIVNLDYGRELVPPKTSYRSEPNDFQRGEVEIDGHNLYFDEWSWSFDFTTLPLDRSLDAVAETLDAIVPGLLADGDIPGAVIAVGRKTPRGFETWRSSYGFMQTHPTHIPMPVDAVFDMASMTKPIATGTSLMQLIEQGKVKLDAPVTTYLPDFAGEGKNAVTVRDLMTHRSGMKPYIGAGGQKKIEAKAGYPCRAALREAVRTLKLSTAAGGPVVYSCLNAILSAEIVERVSGQSLDVYAKEHVFAPLKMDATGFNPPASLMHRIVPTTQAKRSPHADGFLRGEVHDPLAAMQAGVSGNAGLFSSVGDVERYAQMLLNRGELDGVRILKAETVAEMSRVQDPNAVGKNGKPNRRGLLWDTYPPGPDDVGIDRVFAFGHTGYTGTAMRVYPEQDLYIIALTNRVHPDDSGKVGAFRQAVWQAVGRALLGL
jgi:CubicO group peptidase (beta-lactamase class C family)/transglutaminase-like putative cysteine protease